MSGTGDGEYQVDPGLVEALHRKVKSQDEVLEGLEERIEALEEQGIAAGPDVKGLSYDSHDQAVVDALAPGDYANLVDLRKLYRSEAGLRSANVVSERIRNLTDGREFEQVNVGRWQYNPEAESGEGEEDR